MSKFKFVFTVISIFLTSLFIPANVSSAAGRFDDLVVSQVWFQDVSFCEQQSETFKRCFNKSDYSQRTAWVFSVKNNNKKKTAQGVRARVQLIDSAGNVAVSANVRVASAIAPGATVWVAPSVERSGFFDTRKTVIAESAAGGVTSASAAITAATFRVQTKQLFPTAVVDFQLQDQNFVYDYYSYPRELLTHIGFDVVIPNPRKAYNGFATLVLLTDSGTPLMGLRTSVALKQGGATLSDQILLKKQTAALVGEMRVSVAPK
jgi:hypothetical protein